MRKLLMIICVASFAVLLAACGGNDNSSLERANDDHSTDGGEVAEKGDKLQVVASFTIISDMVGEVGGDKVEVYNLVPTGTDPHEYEPLPEDNMKASDADILFY